MSNDLFISSFKINRRRDQMIGDENAARSDGQQPERATHLASVLAETWERKLVVAGRAAAVVDLDEPARRRLEGNASVQRIAVLLLVCRRDEVGLEEADGWRLRELGGGRMRVPLEAAKVEHGADLVGSVAEKVLALLGSRRRMKTKMDAGGQ